jgi:hypothetical protein
MSFLCMVLTSSMITKLSLVASPADQKRIGRYSPRTMADVAISAANVESDFSIESPHLAEEDFRYTYHRWTAATEARHAL